MRERVYKIIEVAEEKDLISKIYPVSTADQIITMMSAVLGIAIVALPASIITAGYMEELETKNK